MPGAHRGPAGGSAGTNARFLAVLVAVVTGAIAVVAGLVWFFTNGTALELTASVLILGVIQLTQSLARGKPDQILVGASAITFSGWQVFSDVTHHPAGGLADFLVRAVSMVCLGIAFVLMTRDLHLGQVWRSIRARLASGPGEDSPAGPG
jgi:hypothetical protein